MKIRGTSNPICSLCEHAIWNDENQTYICTHTNEKTEASAKCRKFKYDIYKYQPRKKYNFSKFSKEDFEI